jgi:hypothetical protein
MVGYKIQKKQGEDGEEDEETREREQAKIDNGNLRIVFQAHLLILSFS